MTLELLVLALAIVVAGERIKRGLEKVARELGNRNGVIAEALKNGARVKAIK